jgi:hypothetical protein
MKKPVAYVCALISLAGCANHEPIPKQEAVQPRFYKFPLSGNAVLFAKTLASYDLKDPDSAKFGEIFAISQNPAGKHIENSMDGWCIEVNGKNEYGAYTGYTWAYEPASGGPVWMGSNSYGFIANKMCSAAEYPPASNKLP